MIESVQGGASSGAQQFWQQFTQSGDPKMYLKYRQGKNENNSFAATFTAASSGVLNENN